MSYYENVYLPRINRNGTSQQERILNTKIKNFETFLPKSIYKVEFNSDDSDETYVGSLQPGSGDEKDIISYMLTPKTTELVIGSVLTVTNMNKETQNWLITFKDNVSSRGYNKYKIYLLDRTLTWYDDTKEEHTCSVNLASSEDASVQDVFKNIGSSTYRESQNYIHIIMKYNENLHTENYCLLNGSPRAFVVSGYDCETVPGVQYLTIDITLVRDTEAQTTTPSGFWGT